MWTLTFIITCSLLSLNSGWAEKTKEKNLIKDGGFEAIREVVVAGDNYIYNAIDKEMVDLCCEGAPVVILPSNFDQFAGCKKLCVVEGTAGKEVHTGKRAIVLNGSVYLRGGGPANTGDVFKARFYAKGKGKVRMLLHLTNTEGKYFGQVVPGLVSIEKEEWTLVGQTLKTDDKPNLKSIWVRMETVGEICLDDLALEKEVK